MNTYNVKLNGNLFKVVGTLVQSPQGTMIKVAEGNENVYKEQLLLCTSSVKGVLSSGRIVTVEEMENDGNPPVLQRNAPRRRKQDIEFDFN